MSRNVSSPPTHFPPMADVIAISDDAALYLTLAETIRGAAVGLSPAAQKLLRRGLQDRFSHIVSAGGDQAVDELVRLATEPSAA